MASLTLSVTKEFKTEMKSVPWVNWSEIAREEVLGRERKIALLDELDELTKDSEITDKDCLEFAKRVQKRFSKSGESS